jgi:hypothetical protein
MTSVYDSERLAEAYAFDRPPVYQLPMDVDAYLRYALSETNVENSIATGACSPEEARDWCQTTLESVFAGGPVTVVIAGHVATLARAPWKTATGATADQVVMSSRHIPRVAMSLAASGGRTSEPVTKEAA